MTSFGVLLPEGVCPPDDAPSEPVTGRGEPMSPPEKPPMDPPEKSPPPERSPEDAPAGEGSEPPAARTVTIYLLSWTSLVFTST